MAKKSPPLPRHRPSHSNRRLIVASLGGIIGTQTLGFGVIGVLRLSTSENLAKPSMRHTASSLAGGIAEQTNDYFFSSCCGALH